MKVLVITTPLPTATSILSSIRSILATITQKLHIAIIINLIQIFRENEQNIVSCIVFAWNVWYIIYNKQGIPKVRCSFEKTLFTKPSVIIRFRFWRKRMKCFVMYCVLRGLFDVYRTQRKVFQMFKVFLNVRNQCTVSWRRSVSVYLAAKETVWGLWLTPMTSSSSDIGLRRIVWTNILSKNLNSPDNTCMYWS